MTEKKKWKTIAYSKDLLVSASLENSRRLIERIQKIINASITHGDQEIPEALEEPFKNKTVTYVFCHENCISSYIYQMLTLMLLRHV